MLCAVRCVIIICFSLLFCNYSIYVFFSYLIVCILVLYLCSKFLVIYFLFNFLLCIAVFSYSFTSLPTAATGGTPIALDKCNIVSFLYTNNIFFNLKKYAFRRGLKVRNFVLFVYIYIYTYACTYIHKEKKTTIISLSFSWPWYFVQSVLSLNHGGGKFLFYANCNN